MIDLKSFVKARDKELPAWFKAHPAVRAIPNSNKVFPSLGLSNFSEPMNEQLKREYTETLVRNLLSAITYEFGRIANYGANNIALAQRMIEAIRPRQELMVQRFFETKSFSMPVEVMGIDGKSFSKEGESLFKVYGKVRNACTGVSGGIIMTNLDDLGHFREFSKSNIDKGTLTFSSTGEEGIWDILTMSERGINSCQGWEGVYKECLIGSILDPFTGLIYLSLGDTFPGRGSKMNYRSIVRLLLNKRTGTPVLFLDIMYPGGSEPIRKLFTAALKARLTKKISIVTGNTAGEYVIPHSEMIGKLRPFAKDDKTANYNREHIFTYRDVHFPFDSKKRFDREKIDALYWKRLNRETAKILGAENPSFIDLEQIYTKREVASFTAPCCKSSFKIVGPLSKLGKNDLWSCPCKETSVRTKSVSIKDDGRWSLEQVNGSPLKNEVKQALTTHLFTKLDTEICFSGKSYVSHIQATYLENQERIKDDIARALQDQVSGKKVSLILDKIAALFRSKVRLLQPDEHLQPHIPLLHGST